MIKINDFVRIDGGTAAVGETGLVVKLTAVMAAIRLRETGVSVRKKQAFLTVIEPPVAVPTVSTRIADLDAITVEGVEANKQQYPPSAKAAVMAVANPNGYTDILVDVPDLTDANRHSLVEGAFAAIESVTGTGSIKVGKHSKGFMVLRNMGQIKFRMTSSDHATAVVSHFAASSLTLGNDRQHCTISFAEAGEKGPKGPSRVKHSDGNVFQDVSNNRDNNARREDSRINSKALPSGRSLADRLADSGTTTNEPPRQRRRHF